MSTLFQRRYQENTRLQSDRVLEVGMADITGYAKPIK